MFRRAYAMNYQLVLIDKKYPIWALGLDLVIGEHVIVRKLYGDKKKWEGKVTDLMQPYTLTPQNKPKNIIIERVDSLIHSD